jgi:hypothetical protein
MAPAPRKPIPVTICAATRPESPVVVVNANEAIVKAADPRQTRMSVRKPAGFSCLSRSVPTTAPQITEVSANTTCSHGVGKNPCKFSMRHRQTMTTHLGVYLNLGKVNLQQRGAERRNPTLEIKASSPTFSARIFSLVNGKVRAIMDSFSYIQKFHCCRP